MISIALFLRYSNVRTASFQRYVSIRLWLSRSAFLKYNYLSEFLRQDIQTRKIFKIVCKHESMPPPIVLMDLFETLHTCCGHIEDVHVVFFGGARINFDMITAFRT